MTWTSEPEAAGEGREIVENRRTLIATVYDPEDAALIAAAPDLLAAAEEMLSQMRGGKDFASWEEAKAAFAAAIAKAKGN